MQNISIYYKELSKFTKSYRNHKRSSSTYPGFKPQCLTISPTYAKPSSTAKGLRGSIITEAGTLSRKMVSPKSSRVANNRPKGKLLWKNIGSKRAGNLGKNNPD
jgi:hypothetical protein